MTAPPEWAISLALDTAARSPCRSKRGVVMYRIGGHNDWIGRWIGRGFNGPPAGCPGRDRCAGTCGQRSVHAEVRALRSATVALAAKTRFDSTYDLVHVELATDGGVVACDGPSCWQCSREILDVGFVAGVWLCERRRCTCGYGDRVGDHTQDCRIRPINEHGEWDPGPHWRRYTADEFHRATLARCGMVP